MPGLTFHRESLAWPCLDSAGAELLDASAALEVARDQWCLRWHNQTGAGAFLRDQVLVHESRFRERLEHPLSATWMALRPGDYDHSHHASRIDPSRQFLFESRFNCLKSAGVSFSEALCSSGSLLLDKPLGLRTGEIGLCRGADGVAVMFGPACSVPERLARLGEALDISEWPSATTAAATMAIVLNIHPFEDGNGRVARALFQCLAQGSSATGQWPPLPWREVIALSRGGFELSLREAEILGRWAPFFRHLANMLVLLAQMPIAMLEVPQPEVA